MHPAHRSVQADGLTLFHIRCWNPVFLVWREDRRHVRVRNQPEDLSRIFHLGDLEMSTPFAHLHLVAREMLALDDSRRIQALQRERWIDYLRASEALSRPERLLNTPKKWRMPCMVVMHSPSNIGKTLIIPKFLRAHPPGFELPRGVEQRPVVTMQMAPTPDQRRFYRTLLSVIGALQDPSFTRATLEQVAKDVLTSMSPRRLIVDEVHHLLAGSHREQRASLNLLKYLANELKICIVAVGTSDAPVAFESDAQISSRFTPFETPLWAESEDCRRLLRAFEQALPLRRPSQLTDRPFVQFLVASSGGLLGGVSRMLPPRRWPAARRTLPDEAFRGWFGRVAGRCDITVDELATAAGIELDLNPVGSGWLTTNASARKSMQELAGLCKRTLR
jgi:hypothetical protein